MSDEQIIALVKEYFTEGGIQDDGSCTEYYGDPDAFLKFAERMYNKGKYDGYNSGYDDGWESSNVSTKMNTWSSDDD